MVKHSVLPAQRNAIRLSSKRDIDSPLASVTGLMVVSLVASSAKQSPHLEAHSISADE